eukprot:2888075-Ditylum_brightwellii.AAC.1
MHDFYFIIDEIIMAGGTGAILYTLQIPKAFIDRVVYISLGKWLGMGAVFCFMENVENVDFGRGETRRTNYNEAFATLNLFSKHSDKAISQQAEVLKELNIDEEDAWEKGIFIYCNSIISKPTLRMEGSPRSLYGAIDRKTYNKKEANDHTINTVH